MRLLAIMTLLAAFTGSAQALPVDYLNPLVDPTPIADQEIPFVPPILGPEHFIGEPMGDPLSPIIGGDDL